MFQKIRRFEEFSKIKVLAMRNGLIIKIHDVIYIYIYNIYICYFINVNRFIFINNLHIMTS